MSNGVVNRSTAIVAVSDDRCGLKAEEDDEVQADKHQLEYRLKGDHDD